MPRKQVSAVRWTRDKDGVLHVMLDDFKLWIDVRPGFPKWHVEETRGDMDYADGTAPTLALAKRCAEAIAKVLGKRKDK